MGGVGGWVYERSRHYFKHIVEPGMEVKKGETSNRKEENQAKTLDGTRVDETEVHSPLLVR